MKLLAAYYDEQARNGRWFLHQRQPDDFLEINQLVDRLAGRVDIHTASLDGGLCFSNSAAVADELAKPVVRAARLRRGTDGAVQDMPPVVTLAVYGGLRREMVNSGVLAQM